MVSLLPLTVTLAVVFAFVLFILRRGWSGYRGLIGAAVFLVLAFGPIRVWLTGTLGTAWLRLGATTDIEAILWGGVAVSVVAIFVLASLIRRTAAPVRNRGGLAPFNTSRDSVSDGRMTVCMSASLAKSRLYSRPASVQESASEGAEIENQTKQVGLILLRHSR